MTPRQPNTAIPSTQKRLLRIIAAVRVRVSAPCFAGVEEIVVEALGDEDEVCEAEVDGEGDDGWDEAGPDGADEVGDVADEPDD